LSKAEIIVGCHIETLCGRASEGERYIVIIGDSVEKGYEATGNASDGTTKAIVDAHLQSTDIKVVKVGIERCIALHRERS